MRKGLLTIFCFLLTVCLYAGQISKEQAHEAARAFLAKRGITMTSDATPAFKAKRKAATSGARVITYSMRATTEATSLCRATTAQNRY